MIDPLRDNVSWITGASSGIGEELAYALARRGGRLILSARSEAGLNRVRAACPDPGMVRLLPLDLEQVDSLPQKAREAAQLFGPIDILINNAGIAARDWALATALDVDRRLMTINYLGPVTLTKAVLPAMLERRRGRIVAISSLSGKFGVPRSAAYSASKHALHGFFDSLRVELRGQGVTLTIVIPGVIRTAITVHALTGSGSSLGKMEQVHLDGMSAEACAAGIVRAIASGKAEVFVGGKEAMLLPFRRFFPGLFYRFLDSHPLKRMRKLRSFLDD